MEENGKYLRLLGRIGLVFVIFIAALFAIMYGLRFLFGVLDFMPWFSMMFALFIICVPAAIFITVYILYYFHTKGHHSKSVRIFSNTIFALVLLAWAYFWVYDFTIFIKHQYRDIAHYNTYNIAFLAANVGLIFFIGIVQALSSKKEVDWMERSK
jgi:hypothetical protein